MQKETKKVKAPEELSGVTVYKLQRPVKFGETLISQIEIQAPKTKHLRKMPLQPSPDDILNLVSVLSGTSSVELNEFESVDYYGVLECMGKLLADGLEIGDRA
jgi:hypothetical protein